MVNGSTSPLNASVPPPSSDRAGTRLASDGIAGISRGTWLFFAAFAVLGTLTTATNIALPMFFDPAPSGIEAQAALRHDSQRMAREWVMLVHAFATLIAPLGLSLWLLRDRPALALTAFVLTFMEKLTELYGQTVKIFTVNAVWRRQLLESDDAEIKTRAIANIGMFGDVWNDMFFVLWVCGAAAALSYACALWRRSRLETVLAIVAAVVCVLALPWIAADYFGYNGPITVPSPVYLVVMTAYRGLIAVVLIAAALRCQRPSRR
jgi:hypothetical protein